MWGPVLGWCALELLAESIGAEHPERVALDLFDRLRLREPFAQAFNALGFEGEEGWRVAARIKIGLLTAAGAGKPNAKPDKAAQSAEAVELDKAAESVDAAKPDKTAEFVEAGKPAGREAESTALPRVDLRRGEEKAFAGAPPLADPAHGSEPVAPSPILWPALWSDPDVRWLAGVHPAEGREYLVRERYEELLWCLLMPSLLRLAGEAAPSRAAAGQMSCGVAEALAAAEAAGYRVDLLMAPARAEAAGEDSSAEADSAASSGDEAKPDAEAKPDSKAKPDAGA
jgi:hypothetical protein